MKGWRAKVVEWGQRYLALEIAATVAALVGGFGAALVTIDPILLAYAGAWSENVGFYTFAIAREIRAGRPDASGGAPPMPAGTLAALGRVLREFGLAELVDSFVSRPLCMGTLTALFGSLGAGIIIGKLAADVIFYAIAIVLYERGKRPRTM